MRPELRPLLALLLCAPTASAEGAAPERQARVHARFGAGVTVEEGDTALTLGARLQLQAFAAAQPEDVTPWAAGALVRRARVSLDGRLPHAVSLRLQLGFAPRDADADAPGPLVDAFVEWRGARDVSLRLGQGKVPFGLQPLASSAALQFVERAAATSELELHRDLGLTLFSDDLAGLDGRLRYAVGLFNGDGRNRVDGVPGLLVVGRVHFAPLGPIDLHAEGDVERSPAPRLGFGASAAWNLAAGRSRSTSGAPFEAARFDYLHAGADVVFRWRGLSLTSEAFYRRADAATRTTDVDGARLTETSRSGWGWYAQLGVTARAWLLLSARYGDVRPVGQGFSRTREAGAAASFLLIGRDLELRADYLHLDDGHGRGARHQARAQLQVCF